MKNKGIVSKEDLVQRLNKLPAIMPDNSRSVYVLGNYLAGEAMNSLIESFTGDVWASQIWDKVILHDEARMGSNLKSYTGKVAFSTRGEVPGECLENMYDIADVLVDIAVSVGGFAFGKAARDEYRRSIKGYHGKNVVHLILDAGIDSTLILADRSIYL